MEKLIRDNTQKIPHPNYPNMVTRLVRDIQEHIQVLLIKTLEEQSEINMSSGVKKIEEIGDLLEIYDTLIDLYETIGNTQEREGIIHRREILINNSIDQGLDLIEIIGMQGEKRELKGGFRRGVIWIYE